MAKRTVQQPDVIDVAPDETTLTTTSGQAIARFVTGLVPFLKTARQLELRANQTLEQATRLKAPTSADEDARIQTFIRGANADRKAVEEHWQITSAISQFHKRLVAYRTRATSMLEQAASIGNTHHNRYVTAETARARAEEDRKRRASEEQARLDRERDLERLEAEALTREQQSPELSEREEAFIDAYTSEVGQWRGNPERAAHVAGYKDASKMAWRLLNSEKILTAIKAKQDAAAIRRQAAAARAMPIEVEVEPVRPDVTKGGDRSTWSAELLDERAFVDAALEGRYGIPRDCLRADPVKLNDYARSMHELIDRWPGVRHKKTTKVV